MIMIRRALLAAMVVAWPMALAAQGPPAATKFTAGGVPVILKPITSNDVVAARLYLRGGSGALTQATAGIERFIGDVSTRHRQVRQRPIRQPRHGNGHGHWVGGR